MTLETSQAIHHINASVYPFRLLSAHVGHGQLGINGSLGFEEGVVYNIWDFRWMLSAHAPSTLDLIAYEPLVVKGVLNGTIEWCPGAEFIVNGTSLGRVGWGYDETDSIALNPGRHALEIVAEDRRYCHTVWGFSRPFEARGKPEFYLSISAICKDKNDRLAEWLDHHIALGVERVFLLDNGSKVPLADTIDALKMSDRVAVERFASLGTETQSTAYGCLLRRYGWRTRWMALIDIDDFIVPRKCDSLPHFLQAFEQCGGVEIPRVAFGACGVGETPSSQAEQSNPGSPDQDLRSIVQPRFVAGQPGAHRCSYVPNRPATGDAFDDGRSGRLIQISRCATRSNGEREKKKLDQPVFPILREQHNGHWRSSSPDRPIHGFMHVAAVNHWEAVLRSQIGKAARSGLYDRCQTITIGVVGGEEPALRTKLSDLPAKCRIERFTSDIGAFEFPTLQRLEERCKGEECFVWYVHTKGVVNTYGGQNLWRNRLEQLVLVHHELATWELTAGHAVAATAIHDSRKWPVPGNFWWAQSEHIASLPPVGSLNWADRWAAEAWIGLNGINRFYSLRGGGKVFDQFCVLEETPGPGLLATDGFHGHCNERVLFDASWRADHLLATHAPSVLKLHFNEACEAYGFLCESASPQGTINFEVDGLRLGAGSVKGYRTPPAKMKPGIHELKLRVDRGELWGCHTVWALNFARQLKATPPGRVGP
jgi:hypothetical protein